ncbi:hypothetical protein [Spirosoma sordidisoli]|uniref:Uncharacterized protein n=1 Tax=Spirosoma sordidisoli TaxID=2502893 RepID=A0A4Q2UN63_9BACT|nr:hypothetical protein [Spirosoma sordidisoli]RYC68219.1 hypothetical protein EQG79_22490 [Spirosoma sordidisoli]
MSQVPVRFPQVALPEKWTAIPYLVSSGQGFNYANYRMAIEYNYLHTQLDANTGRIVQQVETARPQAEANMQKMVRYIAPQLFKSALPIGTDRQRFEGMAYLYDGNDRNAGPKKVQYRTYHLLSFDNAGTLLRDEPIQFSYNRELSFRIPLYDATGNTIGSFNVFPGADGKKADIDPDDSRMTVVITDSLGSIWSQFDRVGGPMEDQRYQSAGWGTSVRPARGR